MPVYDVFISYARADGRELAKDLYHTLEANGLRPWRDERNLNPYQDFSVGIENAIRAARYVVALLTPDVVVRGDSFVRRELLEAQAHNKPIIPLIAPGVHPKNVPIIIKHLTFLTFSDLKADLPKLIDRLRQEPQNSVQPAPTHDPFHLYVRRLRDFVTSELATSVVDPENLLTLSICAFEPALPTGFKSRVLHHNPMISLPKQEFPDFNLAFAAFNGRVLLLGEPGSGKTTMLLAFIREKANTRLVERSALLPIYAPLASWDPKSNFEDWLEQTTGVDAALLRSEIANNQLIFVLDGLDEIARPVHKSDSDPPPSELRIKVLARLKSLATPSIVSCRVHDYEDIVARGFNLSPLYGAAAVQRLSKDHIKAYVANQPELWEALQADVNLMEIARTPLLLTLLAIGYRVSTLQDRRMLRQLSTSPGDLRDRIFANFITERYKHEKIRSAEELPYTEDQVVDKLGRAIVSMLSDLGGRFDFTLLAESDFDDADRAALPELAVRLQLLKPAGKGLIRSDFAHQEARWHCLHNLLRDYLGFRRALLDLNDSDENIRAGAASALGKIGEPRAVKALLRALRSGVGPDTWIMNALSEIRDPRGTEELTLALVESARIGRLCAAKALGNIGAANAVEALIEALRDPDQDVRAEAASALGSIRDGRSVGPLIEALSDPDERVRSATADALGALGEEQAVEPLIVSLGDSDSGVRRSAAGALGALGNQRAVEPLIAALSVKDSLTRTAAASALGQIRDERAVEPLKSLLWDDSAGTRLKGRSGDRKRVSAYAAEALEQIGTPEARSALDRWRRG